MQGREEPESSGHSQHQAPALGLEQALLLYFSFTFLQVLTLKEVSALTAHPAHINEISGAHDQ